MIRFAPVLALLVAWPLAAQDAAPDAAKPHSKYLPKLGWRRDVPQKYAHVFQPPEAIVKALPAKVVNSGEAPSTLDQGRIGTCAEHAYVNAVRHRLAKQKLPDTMPSRLCLYYWIRVRERTVPYDAGTRISDLEWVGETYGAPPESLWPYDDTPPPRADGAWPATARARQKPPVAVMRVAANCKPQSSHVRGDLLSLKQALATGRPVEIGFTVFPSFFDALTGEPRSVVPMPKLGEAPEGGHAVLAWDYDDATRLVKCQNSWGTSVQLKGFFLMPYDYLSQFASDFIVIDSVTVASAGAAADDLEPRSRGEAHHVPPAAAPGYDVAADLLQRHNAERAKHGVPPLALDARLAAAAKDGCARMAARQRLDHFIDGTTPWSRIAAAGYRYAAASENAACGQRDAAQAVGDWMWSRGHRENVLSRQYSQVGFAVAPGTVWPDGRPSFYWVACFGAPAGARMVAVPREPMEPNRAPTPWPVALRPGDPCPEVVVRFNACPPQGQPGLAWIFVP